MQSSKSSRETPRVILRAALDAQFDDVPLLLIELGIGGAKLEHSGRMDVGRRAKLACGDLVASAVVRHSILLPAQHGVVFHTGVSFAALDCSQTEALFRILVDEAREQVKEWEANLDGIRWRPSAIRRSAVSPRLVALHFTAGGWRRVVTSDPNQPLDGIAVPEDTPREEIRVLCDTYENADHSQRELLRRMAMLAILEGMRGSR